MQCLSQSNDQVHSHKHPISFFLSDVDAGSLFQLGAKHVDMLTFQFVPVVTGSQWVPVEVEL